MQDEKLNNNQNVMTDKNGRYIIKSSLERQSEFGKDKVTMDETTKSKKTVTNLADCAIKKNDKHDGLQRDADGRIIIKSSGAIREDVKSNQKDAISESTKQLFELLGDFEKSEKSHSEKSKTKHKSSKRFKDKSLKRRKIKQIARKVEMLKEEALKGASPNVSSIISELFSASNFIASCQDEIYYYDKAHGCFVKRVASYVKRDLMNQFSNDERLVVSADNVNKAYKHLLLNPDIQRDLTQMINLPLINCENGVYNLETGELEKHSPQFGFTSYIQAKYDKNAKGKVFKRFLKDITAGNKDSIQFLQEVIGYLLSTYVWAKKATLLTFSFPIILPITFIFYGVPNSGKSVLLNVIGKIIGKENVSNVALQQLSDSCHVAQLKDATVNIASDLPQAPIKDIGVFKSVVSSLDVIETKELYKNPTSQPCYCKLAFGTNQFVPLNRLDANNAAAFFERLIIVPFTKSIPEGQRNLNIAEELFEERDYILTWAIKGLKRLVENNFVFSLTKESKAVLLLYKSRYCPEQVFFEKYLEFKEDSLISRVEVQKRYEEFAYKRNVNVKSHDILNYITLNYSQVKLERKRINGSKNPIAAYEGLAFTK